MISRIAVLYKDTLTGITSSETCALRELHFFLEDEVDGLIQILEIDQSFDEWETMTVLYTLEGGLL